MCGSGEGSGIGSSGSVDGAAIVVVEGGEVEDQQQKKELMVEIRWQRVLRRTVMEYGAVVAVVREVVGARVGCYCEELKKKRKATKTSDEEQNAGGVDAN